MLMDPQIRNCVTVELKAVKTATTKKARRLFVCATLSRHSQDVLRDELALYLIGGGSDYCRGATSSAVIRGCGIITIMKHRHRVAQPLTIMTDAISVLPALWTLLRRVTSDALPQSSVDCVVWNLTYWAYVLERNGLAMR